MRRYKLNDFAAALVRRVHRQHLHGLALHPVYIFEYHLRLSYLQLIPFSAHGLYQHAQVQHTAPEHMPRVLVRTALHAQREVLLQLFVQSLLNVAARYELALLTEERRVVDGEYHRHRRLIYRNRLQRLRLLVVAYRVAYLEAVNTYQRAYIAALHHIRLHMSHALEGVQLLYLRLHHRPVFLRKAHIHAISQYTSVHAPHRDTTHIGIVVQRGNQHLRRAFQLLRSGDVLDYRVHQRRQVGRRLAPIRTHPTVLRRAVNRLKIKLFLCRVQVHHQVEHLFLHLVGAAVQFVHLVNHHNRLQVQFQRLLQHKSSLWHRTLKRVHQQQHAVCHVQHALHLAAEISVPRSVYDVDFVAFIVYRHVLRQDGDASLALQVVVIQNQLAFLLVLAKQMSRVQHLVHERSLPVVHMRDNRYVPNLLHCI